MSSKEILTLQFGHYSNFVGTHWWNAQELSFEYDATKLSEINHDILYREGLTPKNQVTFTPRVLIADLKGSLKSLPVEGELYDKPPDQEDVDVNWKQPKESRVEERIPKNQFQESLQNENTLKHELDLDVDVWSDFLYAQFHPRSINIIKQYQHKNTNAKFNIFPMGTELWRNQFEEDFCDRIRNYVEECDCLQGFQVLIDSVDGFSGLGTSCIQYLRDEYENKTTFSIPIIPSHYPENLFDSSDITSRILNLGFCFDALREHTSLFVPLCTGINGWRNPGPKRNFNHLNYNNENWYETSAILSAALDTFTLMYRRRNCLYTLRDLSVDLTLHGRKAVSGSLCLPFSFNEGSNLLECLDNWDGPLTQSITPNCALGYERLMQIITLRGIKENEMKLPISVAKEQKDLPAYGCNSISEMLKMYYGYSSHATATNVCNIDKRLPTKCPFPNIFDRKISKNGNISGGFRENNLSVESVPVIAGLHCGSEIGDMIENLHTEMHKIRFKKQHQFLYCGVEEDEFKECLDRLFDFRECYEDNYLI